MSVIEQFIKAAGGVVRKASPPGWSGTVEAMSEHSDIETPEALAWWMYNQGDAPHYASTKKAKGLVEKFCDTTKCY